MITVHQVAQAAGVSVSTVSRALSAPHKVAPDTRDRIAALAAELGYQPNRAAAGLRAGRSSALGLLVPDLANTYFTTIIKGVVERAREYGMGVFVVDSSNDPGTETAYLRSLAFQTDGVIAVSPRAPQADLKVVGAKPLVFVNQEGPLAVQADPTGGVDAAVEHLRQLGHTRIGYVGGPESSWVDSRRRHALAATASTGVDILDLGAFSPTVQGGQQAAAVVIASGATAVITFNSVGAVGLIKQLRVSGLRVPRDLSVIAFDNTFLAELVHPELSSIGADLFVTGRVAADLVMEALGRGGGGNRSVAPEAVGTQRIVTVASALTVRASSGPARSQVTAN